MSDTEIGAGPLMRTLGRTVLVVGVLSVVGLLPACSQAGGVAAQQPLDAASGSLAADAAGGAPGSPQASDPAAPTSPTARPRPPSPRSTSHTTAAARSRTAAPATRSPTARPHPTPTSSASTGSLRAPVPSASPTSAAAGHGGDAEEAEVLRLTNVQRLTARCPALVWSPILARVARAHSTDMAVLNYFDHDGPDGRSPFDRMTAAGYLYSTAAENIAAGQPTAAAVVDAWMKSPGHRANILNCSLRQLGVGVYRRASSTYRVYWTQDFATPR